MALACRPAWRMAPSFTPASIRSRRVIARPVGPSCTPATAPSLEEPEIWLWQSDDDARAWIEQRRRERLFPLVMWEE